MTSALSGLSRQEISQHEPGRQLVLFLKDAISNQMPETADAAEFLPQDVEITRLEPVRPATATRGDPQGRAEHAPAKPRPAPQNDLDGRDRHAEER
ncbi:MAG: hypothetical protein ACLPN6_21600 [Streptosporangiaceae bacterium]